MPGRQAEDLNYQKNLKNQRERSQQKSPPKDEKRNGTKEDGTTQRGGKENKKR